MRDFILLITALTVYVATIFLSNTVLAQNIQIQPLRILIALIPMLPAAFICCILVLVIRRLDEMQRKLQFEALALAFVGTALLTFSYGFLEGVGFTKLSMFAVWPWMAAFWGVGVMIGRLRLR